MLHFASMRSHKSWSDILALWGLINKPPWLKIRSTGADVQGVQKTLSNNHCKQANCLLTFTGRHGVPTSVPSSISCTYARYELTTIVSGTAAFSAYGLILTQMSHINQLLTTSVVNSNSQDFFVNTKTETKTFSSRPRPRPRLFFVLEAPRDQDCGLEDYITDKNTSTYFKEYLGFLYVSLLLVASLSLGYDATASYN